MEFWNIFIIILVVLILYWIMTYNSIISLKNTVMESFSSIDTVLQNRYNLIPNLIEIVKWYMKHESWIMTKVAELRASLLNSTNKSGSERFEKENELQSWMKSIFALSENYPDLKASTNFLELQTQWSEIEDRLQWARRAYNSSVKELNNKKQMFPSSIVASMMSIDDYKMFEAETAAKVEKIDAKAIFNS